MSGLQEFLHGGVDLIGRFSGRGYNRTPLETRESASSHERLVGSVCVDKLVIPVLYGGKKVTVEPAGSNKRGNRHTQGTNLELRRTGGRGYHRERRGRRAVTDETGEVSG